LGTGEHEHSVHVGVAEELRQQSPLVLGAHEHDALIDAIDGDDRGRDVDANGVFEDVVSQLGNGGRHVAENSSVCRSPRQSETIFRTSWMKPMSSMRSASSRTRTETLWSRTCRWLQRSSRRPGVAIRMSTPAFNAFT